MRFRSIWKLACMMAVMSFIHGSVHAQSPSLKTDVLDTYADIALAIYEDSLSGVTELQSSVELLLAEPTSENHQRAKDAWIASRVPYQQSEALRFGNPVVDRWETGVNAWPLDEGLIDYVDDSGFYFSGDNGYGQLNIIANPLIKIGGKTVNGTIISENFIRDELNEIGGFETNVATGFHAIEFLLWGQDLNGTNLGAGNRPYTDFDVKNCTNGNCDRRADYLKSVTDLLVSDMRTMVSYWQKGGQARAFLNAGTNDQGLAVILTGLGSLTFGELAGERMRFGLLIHDPEEEHDCFSDNTHNSHYYNALGIQNFYLGRYKRTDGSVVKGKSLSDLLVSGGAAELDQEVKSRLAITMDALLTLKQRGDTIEAYDQMIGEGNKTGNAVVETAIEALISQARSINRIVAELNLSNVIVQGSDSLDEDLETFE